MSQVGSAFVVVKPIVADFRAEVAQGVSRSLGSATIPVPVSPELSRGAKPTWEKLAAGAAIPAVLPLPVQPTITPQAKAQFAGEARGLRGLLLGAGQGTGARALGIGAGAAGLFLFGTAALKAAKSAATLEQQLDIFQQTSSATADQITRVAEQSRRLGQDISLPGVSAGDAAATMTELAKAGLSVDDVLKGTRGTLQLATAANLDFAAAAELSANALNAFQLSGSAAVKVADLLAGAANAAQGDIGDFGLGLSQVSAVAHQAGLSVQETVTFLTEFAKAGIAGSDAGTSFRVALLRLIAPTKEAKDIFNALGVDLASFQSGATRAPEFFRQLQAALAPLDKATRNAALATIFGTDAIRVSSIAVRDAGASWDTLATNVQRAGQVQEIADARTKGLSGKVSALQSNLETLGTTLGTIALPALTILADTLNATVTAANDALVAVTHFAREVGGIDLGPFGKVADRFKDVASALSPIIGIGRAIKALVPDSEKTAGNVAAITDAFGKVQAPGGKGALESLITGSLADPQLEKAMADAGKKAGGAFVAAAGTEITKQERSVINAAKKTVRDAQAALQQVVREGAAAVEQSAIDAKQSLTSIGQGLASQVVTLLDTGPLAQRITELTNVQNRLIASRDALQERLDRSSAALQRRNLGRELRDAQEELQRAENQLVGGAPQTAITRAANRQFLRPFQERVKDAQAALQEFSAQADIDKATARIDKVGVRIGNLGVQLDKQKEKIQKTLDGIIARFNAGFLSGPQVNAQVATLLQRNVGPMAKAGKAQGFAFKQAFALQLAALQQQIAAILGGPRTAKTGAEPTIVKPADALKAATANRLAAERSVKDAILQVGKAQKDAVTAKGGTNDLLAQILAQTKTRPLGKTSANVATPKPKPRVGSR